MSRKMIIDVGGEEYTFGIDRNEIRRGEKAGLNISLVEQFPATQMTILWTVGLHKYQPNLNQKVCIDLMDKYLDEGGDLTEVVQFLMEEYNNSFTITQTDSKKLKKARVE